MRIMPFQATTKDGPPLIGTPFGVRRDRIVKVTRIVSRCQFARRASAVFTMMLLLSACGDDNQEQVAVPNDFSVKLERSVCLGSCPVYTVSVDASGLVQYDGTRCVAVYGHHETRLSQERLREIMTVFRDVNFYALLDIYRNDEGYCVPGFFDGTVITTTLKANGMVKSVRDWHGCNSPDIATKLDEFERRVDYLLGTAQWVPCGRASPDDSDYSSCHGNAGCQ